MKAFVTLCLNDKEGIVLHNRWPHFDSLEFFLRGIKDECQGLISLITEADHRGVTGDRKAEKSVLICGRAFLEIDLVKAGSDQCFPILGIGDIATDHNCLCERTVEYDVLAEEDQQDCQIH